MTDGYVQVAIDGVGKKVGNFAVTLPAGTIVTDKDGVQSALAVNATVFLQRVVLVDSKGAEIDMSQSPVEALLAQLLEEVQKLRITLT